MKKALRFAGLAAFAIGLVAFILLMAGTGLYYKYEVGSTVSITKIAGTTVLFGSKEPIAIGSIVIGEAVTKLAPMALIAWILIIVALVILLVGALFPLFKIKAIDKVAGALNLVAVLALVAAGVMLFFTRASFISANEIGENTAKALHLGGAYIVAAIVSICGGVTAILPAIFDFVANRK